MIIVMHLPPPIEGDDVDDKGGGGLRRRGCEKPLNSNDSWHCSGGQKCNPQVLGGRA